ncbi:ATPase [Sphingomonas histidinilytica]|jgi:chaperone required for assembly of F1-ATPase|uniref:Chaperone required for the assembly of the F1-ATPase n=1 Tax=Rhizorhabdus histidinilytica TaxID=439228 RepID=A0A1T5DJ80_9SPHN|nr:ATP12 family protein [Rhizorhabdus histidinilytica]MBO9379049.1 ATPase [Rhizorhabdus histidinilytica]QEH80326.1 ATPase [Sphingomonas sp. C8-2]SKB71756.1 Chaperone required for the assembly of the F1-ATPase [Rhizorhabdus histidinilytica]
MKRFYKQVSVEPVAGGHAIRLDGRPVKTPARADLALPTSALAHAVAAEWDAQTEEIDPRRMPLTGLANAAIDRIAPDPAAFAQGLAAYAETDLLCYRADGPAPLVARQAAIWDPLLDWARGRYDVHFETVAGIVHRRQPDETVQRLAAAVAAHDAFHLAALQPLVTIAGSLVIALAVVEGRIDAEKAFAAAHLDEMWQAEQWGEDALATEARENRRADFKAAARLLGLLA